MIPSKLTITSWTEGDEWAGLPLVKITVGPEGGPFAPPADALAVVTMRFKKAGGLDSDVVQLTSATAGQITILDAGEWEFSIPPQIIAGLTYGKWTWRIRCTDVSANGSPKTFLADEVTILETV
jgi:hypothetical protein